MFKPLITTLLAFAVIGCAHQATDIMPNKDFSRLQQLSEPAPVAQRIPNEREYHGRTLSDPYFWLKDQGYPEVDDPAVLDYLTAENTYFHKFLKPHTALVDTLFEEFKGRTDEEETSVPFVENGYEYRWFYRPGEEYKTRTRKNLATGEEQIFLDETKLAEGHEYFVLGDWEVSPDNRLLAYSFDTSGDERYQARVVEIASGEPVEPALTDVQGEVSFSADGKALVYLLLEPEKWQAKNIKVHQLGTPQAQDNTLFYEADDGFFLGFGKTSSKEYFIIASSQGEVLESYIVPANDLFSEPQMLVSREAGFSQSIDHAHGRFFILANDTHKNFRLVSVSDADPAYDKWQTLEEGSDAVYLMGLQTFDGFMAIKARENGVEKIRIRDYRGNEHEVAFPESVMAASLSHNPEFKQDFVRLDYESMITPDTVFDYAVASRSLAERKVKKIPSGYDKSQYETRRLMATARDGARVPVSIVYKKGFKQDGSQPMHLYGYGAYGSTVTPRFSTTRLSLLDRGFSFAVAHVRGSTMMGYPWYLDGKLEKRTNTFNDFVDVAKFLIDENYVAAGNISISGRSAGGELMGAVTNQAPELWRSVSLGVPFVDVLNTMLDASLPLTPPEWEEWGNPIESADAFDLIQSYSPYDNIEARDYPPMLVTGGINDPRVTYWEPAKWTAKMRATKTDDNLLIMRINMGAGHFANSGRYGRLRDYAEEYAFMLLAHGIDR
ncbi:MAG: S9 family peptidase [Gammaproteobacteria bacterium]|nr:S9 family peptidase [Gammaproteobacteria bacterium]